MVKPDITKIKADIYKKLSGDSPDTKIVVKWERLKSTKFPSGVKGFYCHALVSGKGYKTRDYIFMLDNSGWTLR